MLTNSRVCGQTCKVPFSISFSERTTQSIKIKWFDSNPTPMGWEIEVVKKGAVRTSNPTSALILNKEFTLENLTPSTAYELYIRAVCGPTSLSAWNVAIPFNTVLEIPVKCGTNLPLKDNGTEVFLLDVRQEGILGKDIFIEGVDLILEHDWPADLRITLESPQGQQVVLTNHNGTVTDDFGDVNDSTCQRVTSFSAQACTLLKSVKPPFLGTFRMDGDLSGWKQDTLSKGYWKLICFDRAVKDVGNLKFINIKFNSLNCLVPDNFVVTKSDVNAVTLGWKSSSNCKTVKISVQNKGIVLNTFFVECKTETFNIGNLAPNEEYDITISSVCSLTAQSQESCILKASTTCESVSMAESFDNSPVCSPGCASSCNLMNSHWVNLLNDDGQDWLVFTGKTDTENTGPSSDINSTGNYVYIENNPSICTGGADVILQSRCIDILSNISGCDMSFYYHMFGSDITFLRLEISKDNGNTWEVLFLASGNQGDVWKRVTISLKKYDKLSAIFRFTGRTSSSSLGDIAIDQIEFYKSKPTTAFYTFYRDKDNDGYGLDVDKIEICGNNPPKGYSAKTGDCADENKNIYPGALEIQCNGVDENCNGKVDDQPIFNPIKVSPAIVDASCNGSTDGSLALNISGGTAPYKVKWNNGMSLAQINELKSGVYYATITDLGGCVVNTDFFEIRPKTILNVITTVKTDVTCLGKSDGSIIIEHTLGNEPYKYLWSDKSTSKNLVNVANGVYSITVTDNRKCTAELNSVPILAKQSVISDILELKNPLCATDNTGRARLITFNGIQPYKYLWNTGSSTDEIINVSAGLYTCSITDNVGCKNVFTLELKSPSPMTGNILSTESVRCSGESNGSIKTDISGGTAPYTYLWNNFNVTDDIFGLKAGLYTLTVTDANGCKLNFTPAEIKEPKAFEIKIDSIYPATCILGRNGFVSLKAFGGNGNYNYAWSHSEASAETFNNIPSGNYNVTSYDKLGCKSSISNIFIPYVNKSVNISLNVQKENTCYNEKNGIIFFKTDGVNAPYDYNWSFGSQYISLQKTDTIRSLPSGTYDVTVTDNQGCTGISNRVVLEEKIPYYYSVTSLKNNICKGDSNGSIRIEIAGGTAPHGVLWNGGLLAGKEILKLPNGSYTGFISDAKGCTLDILPISVLSSSNIILNSLVTKDTNLSGLGKICINPTGGNGPYQIFWSGQNKSELCLNNLFSGIYQVSVRDQLNCVVNQNFTIENISASNDPEEYKLKIFPNPASEIININSNSEILNVTLFDNSGRFIKKINTEDSRDIQINTYFLQQGIYILKILFKDRTKTLKFIKI